MNTLAHTPDTFAPLRAFVCGLLVLGMAGLWSAPLNAQSRDFDGLEAIYLDRSLGALDYDAHAVKLVQVIEKDPAGLEAWLALETLRENDEKLAGQQALLALLARLERDNFKDCKAFAREYADAYVFLARRADTSSRPEQVYARWKGLTEFAAIGPFAEYGAPAHDDVFEPETRCDFAASWRGVYGTVRWQPLPHHDAHDDRLDFDEFTRVQGACYYVATLLNVEAERLVRLNVEIGGPGKVWLRGAPLLDLDTRAYDAPDTDLKVRLAAGDNLLVLKISGNTWFRVRVCEADGQPFVGKVRVPQSGAFNMAPGPFAVSAPPCPHADALLAELEKNRRLQLEVGEDELDEVSRAAILLKLRRQACLLGMALSDVYRINRLDALATEAMDRAWQALPEERLVQLARLRRATLSSLYSASDTNRLRRRALAAMLAEPAPLAAALSEQAQVLARDERTAEAVEHFERALKASPRAWTVLLDLAQLYQQRGWRTEWLDALERARKLAPDAPAVLRAFARYHEYGGEAAPALARTLDLHAQWPGDAAVRLALVSQYQRAAMPEKALEHAQALLARRGSDSWVIKRVAEAYGAAQRVDEAVALYERWAGMSARPEGALLDAAKLLLSSGREAEGKALLERILKVAPSCHEARRWLARLSGERDDFWRPWALSDAEIFKREVKPSDYPKCGSAVLLDEQVQVVNEDGSARMYVRQVRKILTQAGVDAQGKARPNGEICTARVIKPNGQVLEPVTFRGNNIEYPGLEVGAIIELAWLANEDENPWRSINPARFYFADQLLAEPFIISRLVVVMPANMALDVRHHNWPQGAQRSDTREGRHIVRVWEVRDAKFFEREHFMPSALEFIPWIEFTQARDWRIRARELAGEGLALMRKTELLEAVAAEITRGCGSDEARARRIYEWVNANLLTEGDTRNAHQAVKARAGDRKKAFAALCFAAGIKLGFAYADLPMPYRGGAVESVVTADWAGPGERDFKTFLFVVRDERGGRVFVNLDGRLRPFGVLSQRLDGAPAIVYEGGVAELVALPSGQFGRDGFRNEARLELAADGSASVAGAIETRGERSYTLKELVRKQSHDERSRELQEQVADQVSGFEADVCEFPDLDTVGTPLSRRFKGKVGALAQKTGGKLVLPLPLEKLSPLLAALVNKQQRVFDLVLDFDLCQTDEVRIKPPEGFAFERVPADVLLPCAPLSYALSFALHDGELVIRRTIHLGPGRVAARDYADFVRTVRKLSEAEDVSLRLVKDGVKAAEGKDVLPR